MIIERLIAIPWFRLFAEGSAILLSILLAFAIDEWGEEADNAEREREILTALSDDFSKSREEVREWLGFHEETQVILIEFLQKLISEDNLDPAAINQYLADLSWMDPESHITTGALNSVIAGGELTLISNSELRRILADWPIQIETIGLIQQNGYAFFEDKWTTYLMNFGYLPQVVIIPSELPGIPDRVSAGGEVLLKSEFDHSEMVARTDFHGLLSAKLWTHYDYINIYNMAIERINETLTLIENELSVQG